MPQHGGEKRAIIFTSRYLTPFIVSGNPGALVLPAVKVSCNLGAYLTRRVPANDGQRERKPQLVKLTVGKAAASRRADSPFGELELIALAHSPRLKHWFGQQYAQRIAYTPYTNPHEEIITRYYTDASTWRICAGLTGINHSSIGAQ